MVSVDTLSRDTIPLRALQRFTLLVQNYTFQFAILFHNIDPEQTLPCIFLFETNYLDMEKMLLVSRIQIRGGGQYRKRFWITN
jgi:hypothetical protein